MIMSERSVGGRQRRLCYQRGAECFCVFINDLHLPECVCLKCWTGKPRCFSNWPAGKNS